jgi:hypothetical protein
MTVAAETMDWNAFALEKLRGVLGEQKARATMELALRQAGLPFMSSAADLYLFAQQLSTMDGFVKAVGGMLSLQAVMRGARPSAG